MHRKEQVRRIQTLEVELEGCLERAGRSSRKPLNLIRRHGAWLLSGTGLFMGAILARVSARNMVARSISCALLLLRAQRLLLKVVRSV